MYIYFMFRKCQQSLYVHVYVRYRYCRQGTKTKHKKYSLEQAM